MICPWSAGGGTDRVARQMAAELEAELGVPVNVINATGGGGVTGHTRGAQARGDGYTLAMITVELSMLHWRGLTNLTHRDFAPLQLLNRDAAALFVRGDSQYQSLDDLRDAITNSPKKLKASGTAYGGIWHIAVAGWLDSQSLAADDATWISINGAGPSIQELIAGGVDFICCSLPEADAVVAGGQLRCLGVMADERIAGFEQVPTFVEQGHPWSIAGWRGLAAPPDTPHARLDLLSQAIDKITRGESFQAFMASSGFDMSLENAEQFAVTLEQQDELFGNILTKPAFQSVSGEQFGPMMFPIVIAVGIACVLCLIAREVFIDYRNRDLARLSLTRLCLTRDPPLPGKPHRLFRQISGKTLAAGLARTYRRRAPCRSPTLHGPPSQQDSDSNESFAPGRSLGVVLALIFYGVASEPLGFILTALLMLVGLLLLFKVPRFPAVVVAIGTSVVAYQIFAIVLRVPLPQGLLEW